MKRSFWGVVLILVGVWAFLQAAGYVWFSTGAVALCFVGLLILWKAMRRVSWMGIALGLWLGAMGLFTILFDAHITAISGYDIARMGWPILIVAIGASMMFGRRPWWHGTVRFDHHQYRNRSVGDLRYGSSGPWTLDKDFEVNTGVGDVRVDLTTADITEGVHHVNVTAWIGDLVIRVPDDATVFVNARTNVGDLRVLGEQRSGLGVSLEKQRVVPGSKIELQIDASLSVGELRIVDGPSLASGLVR